MDDRNYEECDEGDDDDEGNVDERFDQENEDEACGILELVQPEEIKVAVPTPSANQRMTKKKQQTITDFFSKQKSNKE